MSGLITIGRSSYFEGNFILFEGANFSDAAGKNEMEMFRMIYDKAVNSECIFLSMEHTFGDFDQFKGG